MPRRAWFIAAFGAAVAAAVVAWRRNPRIGTRTMNEVVNPFLIRRGIAGSRPELGTLEHFGRRSGTRHLTPVHPVPTEEGFRIIVPLGRKSEWAHNVLAAGHCRLQLNATIHDLDEPVLIPVRDVEEVVPAARWVAERLGIMYLRLHRFAERPGRLEEYVPEALPAAEPAREIEPVKPAEPAQVPA